MVPICDLYGLIHVGPVWNRIAKPLSVPYGLPILDPYKIPYGPLLFAGWDILFLIIVRISPHLHFR